jgi:hypothetical protein
MGKLHKQVSEPPVLAKRLLLSPSLSQTTARGFAEKRYYLNPGGRTRRPLTQHGKQRSFTFMLVEGTVSQ